MTGPWFRWPAAIAVVFVLASCSEDLLEPTSTVDPTTSTTTVPSLTAESGDLVPMISHHPVEIPEGRGEPATFEFEAPDPRDHVLDVEVTMPVGTELEVEFQTPNGMTLLILDPSDTCSNSRGRLVCRLEFPALEAPTAGVWVASVNKTSIPSAEVNITIGWQPVDPSSQLAKARSQEFRRRLGRPCHLSSLEADFDGDGESDLARISAGRSNGRCPEAIDRGEWMLAVDWSQATTESWPLSKCGPVQPDGEVVSSGICHAFAAPDLNDDGRAELAVRVQDAAGSIALLQFYELTPDEPIQEPIQIAPGGPGPGEITPGQIGTFTYGSSSDYEENIRCTTDFEGRHVFLVTVAESQGDQWNVFEGTWRYDRRLGLVDFRSHRTYSISKDSPEASDLTAGDSICGAPISEGQAQVEINDFNMVLTYPGDWHLSEESLTPNLGSPREVFSLGSFPLRPGGPNCAQIPSQALHDMAATDVFVTIQERGIDAIPSGFDPRPDNFEPTPGSTDNVFHDCLEPEERDDVGAIHWIWFADQDRYFHLLVAIGRDASPEDTSALWNVLDEMQIGPWD